MPELLHAALASVLWLAVFGLVVGVVNRDRGRTALDPEGVPVAWILFVLGQILVLKGFGLFGFLGMIPMTIVFVGVGIWAWLHLRRGGSGVSSEVLRTAVRTSDRGSEEGAARRVVLVSAAAILAALVLFALLTPPHVWDVQAYHMPMVANYVQNGSLAAWPAQDLRQVYRVNAGELQMASLALLSRSDAAVALPNILALLVGLVVTFLMARRLFRDHPAAWLGVILVLTAPQILLGAVTAKNDVVFMTLVLCAFHWTLAVSTEPTSNPDRRLALAAVATGLAAATKVMGLNVFGAVGLVLLILALRRRLPTRAPFVYGAIGLATILALVGDVYWNNLQQPGDVPVGTAPGEIYFRSGVLNLTSAAHFYLYDLSFKRLVVPQVFEHDFSHYGYFFPFLLVLAVIAGYRAARGRVGDDRGLGVLAALALILFLSVIAVRTAISWDQRFMIWMVPCFALLALAFRDRLAPPRLLVLTSFAAAFAVGNLLLTYTNASDGMFMRSVVHLASTGQRARLVDVNPDRYAFKIDGFAQLDERAQPNDSVLYVGWEDTWMYPAWGPRFTRFVSGVAGAADARERAMGGTYRFVVIEDDAGEALGGATRRAVEDAGYTVLADAEGRTIFERVGSPRSPTATLSLSPGGP